jgi:bifunctional UDP-N-acetylglucosamine pyrophosphorylase/glucosamine-1-phosphate N-acetyltransferase
MHSHIPKVMNHIANFPMVEYLLEVAEKMKSKDIRLVLNSEVDSYIKQNPLSREFKYQTIIQKNISGTASAVKCAIESSKLGSEVLILYADSPLINEQTLKNMLALRAKHKNMSLISLGFFTDIPHGYGRMITIDEYLIDIVEERIATPEQKAINLCNSGIILISAEVLKNILPQISKDNPAGEYYLTEIVRIANNASQSCGYVVADEMGLMGVNSQNQLSEVNFIVQTKLRQKMMSEGVTLIDPNSTFFSKDTIIKPGTIIEPFVYFGRGVSIGEKCIIKAHSYIEGVIIEPNCSVGPFARIRPESSLAEGVSIGNFVEIKNSHLSPDVKAGHLSYIGDAEIGEACNIGAGTIFCNYDGTKKHKTKVGKNVFIGSNSSIIAPCQLQDHSLIGAGSVITKNVAKDELALGRCKQENFPKKGTKTRKGKTAQG